MRRDVWGADLELPADFDERADVERQRLKQWEEESWDREIELQDSRRDP